MPPTGDPPVEDSSEGGDILRPRLLLLLATNVPSCRLLVRVLVQGAGTEAVDREPCALLDEQPGHLHVPTGGRPRERSVPVGVGLLGRGTRVEQQLDACGGTYPRDPASQ